MIRPQAKPTRERDEQFLGMVRRRPCVIEKQHVCEGHIDANHIIPEGGGKVGSKVSDRRTLPFCRKAHDLYHRIGRKEFEKQFAIILEYEIERLNKAYTRLPQPRRTRSVQPKIRRIEVRCSCGRTHKLPPSKIQKGRYYCITVREFLKLSA